MSQSRMCGVVLWSSAEEGRAVIWCEDHGNLAFYKAKDNMHLGVSLDPGDLIDFDLVDDLSHRVAENPRLLVEDHSPNIANGLKRGACIDAASDKNESIRSNVIKLPQRAQSHQRQTVSVA